MATNPNKPGTIAYTIWEKNQANKVASTPAPTPVASQNNTTVVSGGPMTTANAMKTQSTPQSNMPTGDVTVPKPTTTPSVPKTDFSAYKFGQDAMNENIKDNTYLSKRNTDFATQYTTQGLKDYNSVFNELNKNTGFQVASQVDKENTAKSIWDQMQKTQPTTPVTPIAGTEVPQGPKVETFSTGEEYSATDWDKAIADSTDPALKQELIRLKEQERVAKSDVTATADNIKTTSQRTLDDNQYAYDQKTKELNLQLEDAKLKIDRQIADIEKMTSRNINIQEKSGALSGINRGAGFTQGLNNIKQDALDTINRLQVDLNTYNNAVGDAKASAYKTFMQNRDRAIEDFSYQYRNILDNTNTDLAKAVGKYPDLSSEKLRKEIAKIGESFTLKGQQAMDNYISTNIKINQDARADMDQIMQLQEFSNMQEDRLLNQWAGKDGAGYLTLSQNDLMDMVESGQIKQSTAMASINLMRSKAVSTINTLAANGVATPQEVEEVMSGINSGMTPQQAISSVVSKNPSRFTPITKPTESRQKLNDNTLYNQVTGEYKSMSGQPIPGASAGVNIPAVDQATVENSVNTWVAQYPDGAKGSRDGWCGQFVNDYLGTMGLGKLFQDPITQKAGIANSQTPKVGSVAIMDSPTDPQYGHVAIVTKVNADGSFVVKDSNFVGKGIVGTHTVKPGGAKYGFYDPTVGKKDQGPSNGFSNSYNPNMIATYTAFIEKGTKPTEKQINALGGFDKFATDAMLAYTQNEGKKIASQGFKLTDPSFYATMSPEERKTFTNDTRTINNVIKKIDDIVKTVQSMDGMPIQSYTGEGRKLKGAISDLQLQLKNEGVYNLGVLNGPDLDIINSVIPQVGVESWVNGKDNYIGLLQQARNLYTTQVNEQNKGRGIEFTPSGQSSTNTTTPKTGSLVGTGKSRRSK